MRPLPPDVAPYKRTAQFTASTIPAGLRHRHSTRAGVWARIHVVTGALLYRILEPSPVEHVLTPERPGSVEPETPHEVEPLGEVEFYVEFLRAPA